MGAIELGQLIRQARLRLGWQQQDLAKRLEVDPAYISAIEGGKRNWPQQYVSAIADALGIDEVDMAVAAGLIRPRTSKPELNEGKPAYDPNTPVGSLALRVLRTRLYEDDVILLNRMFDTWDERNRRDRDREREKG